MNASPSPLATAVRVGLTAGVIAAVIRFIFVVTLEQGTVGQGIGLAVAFFVGTAVVATVVYLVIARLTSRQP